MTPIPGRFQLALYLQLSAIAWYGMALLPPLSSVQAYWKDSMGRPGVELQCVQQVEYLSKLAFPAQFIQPPTGRRYCSSFKKKARFCRAPILVS